MTEDMRLSSVLYYPLVVWIFLPSEVVVIEVEGDELVQAPEGVLGHPGQLVGRHGECLQLV